MEEADPEMVSWATQEIARMRASPSGFMYTDLTDDGMRMLIAVLQLFGVQYKEPDWTDEEAYRATLELWETGHVSIEQLPNGDYRMNVAEPDQEALKRPIRRGEDYRQPATEDGDHHAST